MKFPFLGPNGGEPVARLNAGGTVSKGEPRGFAKRPASLRRAPARPIDAAALNGRAGTAPRASGRNEKRAKEENNSVASRGDERAPREPGANWLDGLPGDVRRRGRVSLAVFASLLFGVAASAQQVVVQPGGSGSLTWEIDNNAQSGGPMTNVAIAVTPPSQLTILPSSKLGPVPSIAAGGNYVFQIDYTVDSQASGQISLPIHFSQDTQYATFKTTDTSVMFVRSLV